MSKTGVSSPSLATDHDGNRTKVQLPRPVAKSVSRSSLTPEFQRSVAKSVPCSSATSEPQRSAVESVPHVSPSLEFQGSAVSVLGLSEEKELKDDLGRDCWIKVWDECSSDDSLFDGWSDDSPRDSGACAQHKFYPYDSWRSEHWNRDSWHSSHWRTRDWRRKDGSYHGCDGTWSKHLVYDSWNSTHWKTIGWDQKNERHHDHIETQCFTGWDQKNERRHDHFESQWFTHAFFKALSVDQLINSLHREGGDTTIFTGLEVDPGESPADTAAQSWIIDLRPFRKAQEALFYKFGLIPRVINGNHQAVGIGGKAKVLGKVEMLLA